MDLIGKIQSLIKKEGISKYKLAKETGIPYTTLIKILDGTTKNPQIESLSQIAEHFNISVDYLIGESASALIEEKLNELGMTPKELSEKAKVPITFLEKLDDIVPDFEVDGGEQCFSYISSIAWILDIKPSKLRQAFARQAVPSEAYGRPALTPEEAFKSAQEDFADVDFSDDEIPGYIAVNLEGFFKVPILGSIRGGPPTFAAEEIEGYMHVDPAIAGVTKHDRLYYLRITGDSMTPKYQPGDLVLIRQQSIVDNGTVAAVLIEGQDACLKKVYFSNGDVWLHSTNPAYDPFKVPVDKVLILGKAMCRLG